MAIHVHEILGADCRKCIAGEKVVCPYGIPGNEVWCFDGKDYRGCPLSAVTVLSNEILRAYNFYVRSGAFPDPGCWPDQSAIFVESVDFIDKHRSKK